MGGRKDGWTITHDPYTTTSGKVAIYADLGAEELLEAERSQDRFAVEIKSFVGRSPVRDFESALGQYLFYLAILKRVDPGRWD